MTHLGYLIANAKKDNDWTTQVEFVYKLEQELKYCKMPHSVRYIAELIEKSKSWVSISLMLAKSIKEDPSLRNIPRTIAYKRIVSKL